MNKISILTLVDKKKRDIKEYEEFETYSQITAKNSKRSLNKILKKYKDETVIISNNSLKEPFLESKVKPYKKISKTLALEIIEKICREVALKYNLKLPLEEVYLYARPETACEFIKNIVGISRIYTIVSNSKNVQEADNLYFEYGCPVRHIKKMNSMNTRDSIFIFIDECGFSTSPIINLTEEEIAGENVTDIKKISVTDSDTEELTKAISAVGGLALYTLVGKRLSDNATVNINKKADTIFLLDTNAI